MIEIKIPKEIKEYKSKLFFNLTVRQCICSGVALGICVPLYIFGKNYMSEDLVSWIVILIAVPLFLMGFFKYNNMYFEEFAKEWIAFNFGIQRRKYEYEPVFFDVRKMYLSEELTEETVKRQEILKLRKRQKKKK
ncbi:MAG: PrgI family protein [Ruminococcus sp.]|nr:PrgI family protein [Ruminococcus sp.]